MSENPPEREAERTKIEVALQKDVPTKIPLNGKTGFVVMVGNWAFGFGRTNDVWTLTIAQFQTLKVGWKKTGRFLTRVENVELPVNCEIPFVGLEGILGSLTDSSFPEEVFTIRLGHNEIIITLQCDWVSKLVM